MNPSRSIPHTPYERGYSKSGTKYIQSSTQCAGSFSKPTECETQPFRIPSNDLRLTYPASARKKNAAGSAPKLVRSIGAERAALFRIETRSRNVGVIAPEGRAAVARVPIDPRGIGVRLDPDVVSVQAVPAVRIRRPLARSEIDARLTDLKLCWNDRADREKKGKRRRSKCSSLLSGNTHPKTSLPH